MPPNLSWLPMDFMHVSTFLFILRTLLPSPTPLNLAFGCTKSRIWHFCPYREDSVQGMLASHSHRFVFVSKKEFAFTSAFDRTGWRMTKKGRQLKTLKRNEKLAKVAHSSLDNFHSFRTKVKHHHQSCSVLAWFSPARLERRQFFYHNTPVSWLASTLELQIVKRHEFTHSCLRV